MTAKIENLFKQKTKNLCNQQFIGFILRVVQYIVHDIWIQQLHELIGKYTRWYKIHNFFSYIRKHETDFVKGQQTYLARSVSFLLGEVSIQLHWKLFHLEFWVYSFHLQQNLGNEECKDFNDSP